ncbi:MAG: hypothetical protein HY744_34485 [Deltaproteobacteria bacterium]|nr:hypothetical protein [Deltaproteobacteria bacterium]
MSQTAVAGSALALLLLAPGCADRCEELQVICDGCLDANQKAACEESVDRDEQGECELDIDNYREICE